jgi:hypothetical protein
LEDPGRSLSEHHDRPRVGSRIIPAGDCGRPRQSYEYPHIAHVYELSRAGIPPFIRGVRDPNHCLVDDDRSPYIYRVRNVVMIEGNAIALKSRRVPRQGRHEICRQTECVNYAFFADTSLTVRRPHSTRSSPAVEEARKSCSTCEFQSCWS